MHRRRFLTTAGSLGAFGGLAGCGSSSEASTPPPSTDRSTSPAPTDTATDEPTPTPTETGAPSIPHEEVPVHPDAEPSQRTATIFKQSTFPPVPATATTSGYQVSASVDAVAQWYESNSVAWTRQYDIQIPQARLLTYTRADTGAYMMLREARREGRIMLFVASMAESTLFPGAPALGHLGVDVGPYDPETGRAGGFDFDALQESGGKPLFYFGEDLGGKLNSAYEYRTAADATVYAAIDGVVWSVEQNPDRADYTVLIGPTEGSPVYVDQDHVLEPAVSAGDTVSAGDEIGLTGLWGSDGVGRTEVQVSHFFGPHYCPLTSVQDGMRSDLEEQVTTLVTEWAEVSGSAVDDQVTRPGCLRESWIESD